MPSLRARKALKRLAPGALLHVRATDPRARTDIPALCELTGDTVLAIEEDNGVIEFRIRRN